MGLVKIFDDGQGFVDHDIAIDQGRHQVQRVDTVVITTALVASHQVDGNGLGGDALQVHRDAHPKGRRRTPKTIQLH